MTVYEVICETSGEGEKGRQRVLRCIADDARDVAIRLRHRIRRDERVKSIAPLWPLDF